MVAVLHLGAEKLARGHPRSQPEPDWSGSVVTKRTGGATSTTH